MRAIEVHFNPIVQLHVTVINDSGAAIAEWTTPPVPSDNVHTQLLYAMRRYPMAVRIVVDIAL